jgi:hypothetical protein
MRKLGIAVVSVSLMSVVLGVAVPTLTSTARGDDDDEHSRCINNSIASDVPAILQAPSNECLKEHAVGVGVQIYTCTNAAWVFKAPEADLTKPNKPFVGNHFLGPNWQWKDGSKVKGTTVQQVPAPDAKGIPWLLLSAVTAEDNVDGKLSDVLHIQRVHTVGGAAPALPCMEGATVRVRYQADYLFYHLR